MTKQKQAIKKILTKLNRDRKKRFDFETKQRIDEFQNYQTRNSRGVKTLDRLIKKGIKASGLDQDFLEKHHEKDDASSEKFAKKQLKDVEGYAKKLASKRKRSARKTQSFLKKHFGKSVGNPAVIAPMKTATNLTVLENPSGSGSITLLEGSKGPWNNTIRTTLTAGSGSNWGVVYMSSFYDYVWQSTVTGIATVEAWMMLNGTYSLSAAGKCIGTREAWVLARASVGVSQPIPSNGSGEIFETTTILDERISARCTSKSRSGVLDNEDLRIVSKAGIPIVANLPTIVSVSLSFFCNASKHANVTIDASSNTNYGLNVPSTFLIVDY